MKRYTFSEDDATVTLTVTPAWWNFLFARIAIDRMFLKAVRYLQTPTVDALIAGIPSGDVETSALKQLTLRRVSVELLVTATHDATMPEDFLDEFLKRIVEDIEKIFV